MVNDGRFADERCKIAWKVKVAFIEMIEIEVASQFVRHIMLHSPSRLPILNVPTGLPFVGRQQRLVPSPRRTRRDIELAITSRSLRLDVAPRIALGSDRIAGVEASIAWPRQGRAMLPGDVLLRAAEHSGQIIRIGDWLLGAACAYAAHADRAEGTISITLSGRELVQNDLVERVRDALDRAGLPPAQLELQLSERLLTGVSLDILLSLSALRDYGVGIAMDDFGTGQASLAMLKRLPLTTLKLDRGLIRDVPHDREDAAIARAIIETGHALGFEIVAQGVDVEAQLDFLRKAGCDKGQGELFAGRASGG